MICEHCEYEWETRKEKPKACPRCKRRFDYPLLKLNKKLKRGVNKNGK